MSIAGGTTVASGPAGQRAAISGPSSRAGTCGAHAGTACGFAGLLVGLGEGGDATDEPVAIQDDPATPAAESGTSGAAAATAGDNSGAAQAFLAQWLNPAAKPVAQKSAVDADKVAVAATRQPAALVSTSGVTLLASPVARQDSQAMQAQTPDGAAKVTADVAAITPAFVGAQPSSLSCDDNPGSRGNSGAQVRALAPALTTASLTDTQTPNPIRIAQAGDLLTMSRGLSPAAGPQGVSLQSVTLGRQPSVGPFAGRSDVPADATRLWPPVVDFAPPAMAVTAGPGESRASLKDRSHDASDGSRSRSPDTFAVSMGAQPMAVAPPSQGGTSSATGVNDAGATAVAQQLKNWIANDIRSAELKLDGLGSGAVTVHIAMSGSEAQLVFRADQASTRELLGSAMGQLDQMLRDQGLSLGGAWVGSSGAQGQASTPAPTVRSGVARGTVEPLAVLGEHQRVAPDRMLDLFV